MPTRFSPGRGAVRRKLFYKMEQRIPSPALTAFLDRGAREDAEGAMCLAACLFKRTRYQEFVRRWRTLHRPLGVDMFNACDFYPGGGAYRHADREKKEQKSLGRFRLSSTRRCTRSLRSPSGGTSSGESPVIDGALDTGHLYTVPPFNCAWAASQGGPTSGGTPGRLLTRSRPAKRIRRMPTTRRPSSSRSVHRAAISQPSCWRTPKSIAFTSSLTTWCRG